MDTRYKYDTISRFSLRLNPRFLFLLRSYLSGTCRGQEEAASPASSSEIGSGLKQFLDRIQEVFYVVFHAYGRWVDFSLRYL